MRKAVEESLTVYLLRWQPTCGTTIGCGYSSYDGKIPGWSLNDSIVVVFEKFRKSVRQGFRGGDPRQRVRQERWKKAKSRVKQRPTRYLHLVCDNPPSKSPSFRKRERLGLWTSDGHGAGSIHYIE
jgi:hypothetical protein